jgi:hypothetical protein
MSGVGMMMLGSGGKINAINSTMTVGSQSYSYLKVTYYLDGWLAGGSETFFGATAMGSMTAAGQSIALFWKNAGTGHGGNGQVWVEVNGNVPTGYVTFVSSNATSLGTVTYSGYQTLYDTTLFTVGGPAVANPFGTSGTKTIVIS